MIGVSFSKATAERFMDCLGNGKAIEPKGGQWTADKLLMLAGARRTVLVSQGPRLQQAQGANVEEMSEEQREALNASMGPEISGAIEWVSDRTFEVIDDEYDQHFEPEHAVLLEIDGESKSARPVSGFKDAGSPDAADEPESE